MLLAQFACEQFQLEQVHFVTSPRPPHRQDVVLPGELRHAMVSLAVSGNDHFIASAVELKRPGPSYTIDTIKYFQEHIKDQAGQPIQNQSFIGCRQYYPSTQLVQV